jgi:hypothetical protein
MNDNIDDNDTVHDGIFAEDLVKAAQDLLNKGINSCHFLARKLQNWINEVKHNYKPQFESL